MDYLLSSKKSVTEDESIENAERKHRKKWDGLTVYNKVSLVALAIMVGFIILEMLIMILCAGTNKLAMWLPLMALIGSAIIKILPVVGVGSAVIGIVAGSIGKGERQNKPALVLISLNVLFPVLCMLVLFILYNSNAAQFTQVI